MYSNTMNILQLSNLYKRRNRTGSELNSPRSGIRIFDKTLQFSKSTNICYKQFPIWLFWMSDTSQLHACQMSAPYFKNLIRHNNFSIFALKSLTLDKWREKSKTPKSMVKLKHFNNYHKCFVEHLYLMTSVWFNRLMTQWFNYMIQMYRQFEVYSH